ncbi:hypothetical protein Rsub_02174 [Raphidocelis subcapitata]|uniref:Glycoside hydrolase n=1 Tax=Raphidocelis subcapitata TaxID=307507 RepID=A0A2V0NWI0_9CHLO|nr:hypothetical protein Rsub_02174 [Raphidocelis subcapitata]|eukprot:GBF89297.1 hypothetical protein Rsub_02174 [Raphidocelis subcapitata]
MGALGAISSSVLTTNLWDFESPCAAAAANARAYGGGKINIVVTVGATGDTASLESYHYKDGSGNTLPVDSGAIGRFRAGLEKCFKAAVDAGFSTIHVLPHVDPVNRSGGNMRNVVKFDPLAKIGPAGQQFSYDEVVLRPIAEALNAATRADTRAEITLAGEQGLSVFSFPRAWAGLLGSTKAASSKGKDASRHTAGISFNWDKVCGCVEPEERDPLLYNTTYNERFERFKGRGGLGSIDVGGVKDLLDKSDFIGISAYASLPPGELTPASHDVSAQTANFEFNSFGIDLKEYMFSKGKPFVFSEQGLGGCQSNDAVAPDLGYLAKHPFQGCWGGAYDPSRDPWKNAEFRAYRRRFYETLSQYVKNGGGQYRVDDVFVWTIGSWDVLGIHPTSSSQSGSWRDDAIVSNVKSINGGGGVVTNTPAPATPAGNGGGGGGGDGGGAAGALGRIGSFITGGSTSPGPLFFFGRRLR